MEKKRQRFPDSFLVLLLFGVFAACILAVLLTGADAYKRLTDRDSLAFESRTAARYVETRLRQADAKDGIFLGDFARKKEDGESPALFLRESVEGVSYLTRVYCHDGYLRELFSREDMEMEPEDGEKIVPVQGLTFQWTEDGRIRADLTDSGGRKLQIFYKIRSEQEGTR